MTAVTTPTPKPVMLQTSRGRRFRDRLARVVLTLRSVDDLRHHVLIIGTLAFDAWDFIRQVTEAEPGLGWQLVLVVLAAFGIAAGVGWLIARSEVANVRRWVSASGCSPSSVSSPSGLTIVGGWRMLDRFGTRAHPGRVVPPTGLVRHEHDHRRDVHDRGDRDGSSPCRLGSARRSTSPSTPAHGCVGSIKPIIEILAGIPSVVLAYFAITFINPNIVVRFFNPPDRAFRMLAAGIAVGVLTVPIIASVTEDALRAVPMSFREASFGLGAQRSQTTFRVVFPAGVSGIVAALILGISRAIGETMVVAIAAGAVGGALFHFSPLAPGQTMTAAMAGLSFGSDQVAGDAAAFQSLFFVGALLFIMTLRAQRARRQARQPGPRGLLMFRPRSFARCARSLHSGELEAGGLRPHEASSRSDRQSRIRPESKGGSRSAPLRASPHSIELGARAKWR